MSADTIAQSLNEQFQADNVFFQIVEHGGVVHVYLNHHTKDHLDYSRLTEGAQRAVALHCSKVVDGFWLYSRELGKTEPDWQTYIQIPRQFDSQFPSVPHEDGDNPSLPIKPLLNSRDSFIADDAPTELPSASTLELKQQVDSIGEIRDEAYDDGNLVTEMVVLVGSSVDTELSVDSSNSLVDEAERTVFVPHGGVTSNDLLPSSLEAGTEDERAETEMVPLGSAGGTSGLSSNSSDEVPDDLFTEEAATELVILGSVAPGMASSAVQASAMAAKTVGTEPLSPDRGAHKLPAPIGTNGDRVSASATATAASTPHSTDDITQKLDGQFRPDNLRFQVTKRDRCLHICANRDPDAPFDFSATGDRVRRALLELDAAEGEAFWFYSRLAGQRQLDQKILIKFAEDVATQRSSSNSAAVGTVSSQSSVSPDRGTEAEVPLPSDRNGEIATPHLSSPDGETSPKGDKLPAWLRFAIPVSVVVLVVIAILVMV